MHYKVHKFLDRKLIRNVGLLTAPGLQTHAGTASKFAKFLAIVATTRVCINACKHFLGGSWSGPKISTANYSW